MRRLFRALTVAIGLMTALVVGLVLALFSWASLALKADLSPPDPSSVPPAVIRLLRVDLGDRASHQAARYLIENDPTITPMRYRFAWLLAIWRIEYGWAEDEQLAQIALHSYFGQGFHGVHEAAHGYFGVPAEALTVQQTAALVAITWSPNRFNPWCHADQNAERVSKLLAALPGEDVAASLEGLLPPTADACARQSS